VPLFLALDLGTTVIKVGLFDAEGNLIALSRREYPLVTNGPFVEVDTETCWHQIVAGIRDVLSTSGALPGEVIGLSISSQGQTFLPVDRNGHPLGRAMVWLDRRATAEADSIRAALDPETLYRHTGLPDIGPGLMACNLLWLRRHEPELFQQAHRFLHIGDHFLHRFTHRFVAEKSLNSGTGLYDIITGTWWTLMADLVGLSAGQLSELVPSGLPIGRLTPVAAQETGLSPDTVAISGTIDVVATALGSNALSNEHIALSLGTTMQTNVTLSERLYDLDRKLLWICEHALPGSFLGVLWRETAGLTLRWFRDVFCAKERHVAEATGQDAYDLLTRMAGTVPPGADGLLILPYLQGNRLPESIPGFRGIFFGISPSHNKGHFVRAILEGVAYALRENLEFLTQMGIPWRELCPTGGGAKSQLWNQINADVTGYPLRLVKCSEASLLGAAILAAIGTGIYPDAFEACNQMVQAAGMVYPNSNNRPAYEKGYQRFQSLYEQTKELFR
jgi:xylulokinase